MDSLTIFYILLLCVAFLYASVGHGGASGYIALMVLYNITPAVIKPTALLLNTFVSITSFIQFYRGGYFKPRLFLPFAIGSVPFAFGGGIITLDGIIYRKILGTLLIIAVVRFLFFQKTNSNETQKHNTIIAVLIGALVGFFSGLIGIGGGIILSPVLLLLRWANIKQAAAISALFIFVNSLSGLAGQLINNITFTIDMIAYIGLAFVGGLLGAYFGSFQFHQKALKYILSFVLLVAAFKLLFV